MRPVHLLLALPLIAAACRDTPAPEALLQPGPASWTDDSQDLELLWGPHQFMRGTGKPVTETISISSPDFEHFTDPFVLTVQNGDGLRASSATVVLDGVTVFGPADFSQQAVELESTVSLQEGSQLAVTLASKPGATITIWVEGSLRPGAVGPRGGVVMLENGAITLDFPPGALQDVIAPTAERTSAYPAQGNVLPGSVFDLRPEGVTFDLPVTLTMAYDPAVIPFAAAEADVLLGKVVSGVWQEIDGSAVDEQLNVVSADIRSFSVHGPVSDGKRTVVRVLLTATTGCEGPPPICHVRMALGTEVRFSVQLLNVYDQPVDATWEGSWSSGEPRLSRTSSTLCDVPACAEATYRAEQPGEANVLFDIDNGKLIVTFIVQVEATGYRYTGSVEQIWRPPPPGSWNTLTCGQYRWHLNGSPEGMTFGQAMVEESPTPTGHNANCTWENGSFGSEVLEGDVVIRVETGVSRFSVGEICTDRLTVVSETSISGECQDAGISFIRYKFTLQRY